MINKPVFHEKEHKYINPLGLEYISVTTLIHKLQPVKDWNAIAQKYIDVRTKDQLHNDISNKYNIELSEVISIFEQHGYIASTVQMFWEVKKDASCEKGTAFHNNEERKTLESKGEVVKGTSVFIPIGNIDVNLREDNLSNLPQGIYPELLVWSDKYKIAGKIDKPFLYVEDGERFCKIDDYKTNESIKKYNYIDKRGNEIINEYLKKPVAHLPNTNYWHYQLQINMYGFLLSEFGWKFKGGDLLHAPNNEIIAKFQIINLQKEIKDILEWRMKSLKS